MGTLRLVLALALFAAVTPFFALYQLAAIKTGLLNAGRAPRIWHALVLRLLGLRVHVAGEVAKARPLLLVSNHVSWTDIVVLGSLAEIHFISKAEVADWPVIGTLARLQRTVFVDRAARRRAGDQVGEIAGRLAEGAPMVLFAEGTSADGNIVLPFKSTLFAAAGAFSGGGAAVQPVAIAYTRQHGMVLGRQHRPRAAWIGGEPLAPNLVRLLKEGAMDVEIRFGEVLPAAHEMRRKALAREAERQVRAMVAAALRAPRPAK